MSQESGHEPTPGAELGDLGMTALQEGAFQLHELYSTWVSAGFSDAQAIYLLGCLVAAQVGNGSDTPSGGGGAGEPPAA